MRKLLCCLLLLSLHCSGQTLCHLEQEKDGTGFSYNQQCLDSLLRLSARKAVFFGEMHVGRNFIPDFKYRLLVHLNSEYGFRDVFMEVGYSAAWRFNQYLQTGDATYLRCSPHSRIAFADASYYKFWQQLYRYNQSLPAGKGLIIYATDFERVEAFEVLLRLIPADQKIPAGAMPLIAAIKAAATDTTVRDFTKDAARRFKQIRRIYREHSGEMNEVFGRNAAVAERIIDNEAPQTPGLGRNREMFEKMQEAVSVFKIEKMVGLFGFGHIDYSLSSSLSNQLSTLAGFSKQSIINICSLVYNVYNVASRKMEHYTGGMKDPETIERIYANFLGSNYKATLIQASAIGEKYLTRRTDYVVLANDSIIAH